MLVSFELENWLSFRDTTRFNMTATREKQHGERVPSVDKYQARILPVAAIYGGNASGKTNFFQALSFARTFITSGTPLDSLIPIEPFRLDGVSLKKPVRLKFELLIDEIIYEYSFSVSREAVLEEKLIQITSTSEKTLFHRLDGKPNFDKSLKNDNFLKFAFKGTRPNQLFLTNSVSQGVERFQKIHNWFRNKLELVAPDSRFEPFDQFLDTSNPLNSSMSELLHKLDTGIVRLGSESIPFESLNLPPALKQKIISEVKEGLSVRLHSERLNNRVIVSRKDDDLVAHKLISYHPSTDGNDVKFEIYQESDGTQRVIDLLPAFLDLVSHQDVVYVIDEIDRSLHPLLIEQLLEQYLDSCNPKTRKQLLFTTHNMLLMDQKMFRRDEMWITERNSQGVSSLTSFSDFSDIRYDKDIRKSYLEGRMGGVPKFKLSDFNFENSKSERLEGAL